MEQEQQTKTTPAESTGDKAKNGCCHKHWPAILFAVLITTLLAAGGTYLALMQKMVKDRAAVAISVRSEAQNEITQVQSQVEALQDKIDEMKKENKTTDTDKEAKYYYKSFNLGVEFNYFHGSAYEKGNELGILNGVGVITVFDKSANETLESAIKKLIAKEGKNPDDCKIVVTDHESGSQGARIVLAQSYEPTQEEIDELSMGGVYPGARERIIESKTKEVCSYYAYATDGPQDYFIYQPNNSETKFVFVTATGRYDPTEIDSKSIKITDHD